MGRKVGRLSQDAGLVTGATLAQAASATPCVAVAVVLGTFINRRLDPALFSNAVAAIIVVLGVLCVSTAAADLAPTVQLLLAGSPSDVSTALQDAASSSF